LFSGVLQYLEAPFEIMRQVSGLPIPFVIIDRTPYWMGPRDRICIQTVPPSIYPASYPSWIFSREHFLKQVLGDYEILSDFEAIDRLTAPVSVSYRGLLMANRRTCGNPYGGLQ
jgi:putative methyltransferase (TIGR04325 family)